MSVWILLRMWGERELWAELGQVGLGQQTLLARRFEPASMEQELAAKPFGLVTDEQYVLLPETRPLVLFFYF